MDELERKRRASDDHHLQETKKIRQLSGCCPCVHCHCRCHNAGTTAAAIEDAAYLDSLPIGYRFDPTDNELITHYLLKKIQNQSLPKNRISEANIYGDQYHHPKDIVGNYPQAIEGCWYFFTSRNRKYVNGKRPNRKAGNGYWKATGPDKVIEDINGIKIGGKKSLVYHEGHPPNGTKTNWMMHEYVVEGYERRRLDLADMKLDDYVLCKIYHKADRGKQMVEQAVTNQQPAGEEASNDRNETLSTTDLEVENQRALVPYQQAFLSSNHEVNPQQYSAPNLDPPTLHVENQFMNSNQNSNPAVIHDVENSFPVQNSNQHMNPIVQNRYEEVNRHVMVHDQQARVVSYQNTILQVEDNVVAQNYQNVGSIFDIIAPYQIPHRHLEMRGYQRMIHHSSRPSGFTSMENHPSTPRQCPPLPPRIVEYAHPAAGMYLCGQSSTQPTSSPAFQKGNRCDPVDPIELIFSQDADDVSLEQLFADELETSQKVENSN